MMANAASFAIITTAKSRLLFVDWEWEQQAMLWQQSVRNKGYDFLSSASGIISFFVRHACIVLLDELYLPLHAKKKQESDNSEKIGINATCKDLLFVYD